MIAARALDRPRHRAGTERGSMSVEIVVLAPVLMMFIMLVVAAGRYVSVKGDIEASARDAARAASLQRDYGSAQAVATHEAQISLDKGTTCHPAALVGDFGAGGIVTVELDCKVSYDGLGLIGLPGSVSITARSSAPIDTYEDVG